MKINSLWTSFCSYMALFIDVNIHSILIMFIHRNVSTLYCCQYYYPRLNFLHIVYFGPLAYFSIFHINSKWVWSAQKIWKQSSTFSKYLQLCGQIYVLAAFIPGEKNSLCSLVGKWQGGLKSYADSGSKKNTKNPCHESNSAIQWLA